MTRNVTHNGELVSLFSGSSAAYQVRPGNFYLSLLLHTAAIAVLLWLTHKMITGPLPVPHAGTEHVFLTLPPIKLLSGDDGGRGGSRDFTPPSHGALPQPGPLPLAPPIVVTHNTNPILAVAASLPDTPQLKIPQNSALGDLASLLDIPSSGVGSGIGIGSAQNGDGGIGTHGKGLHGGTGTGTTSGGLIGPRPIYKVDPEFSEEARKVHYQGVAIVQAEVGVDGLVHGAHIARTLGMGLDERALVAVRQWKFEPAKLNGKPVAITVNIEVGFRLY